MAMSNKGEETKIMGEGETDNVFIACLMFVFSSMGA